MWLVSIRWHRCFSQVIFVIVRGFFLNYYPCVLWCIMLLNSKRPAMIYRGFSDWIFPNIVQTISILKYKLGLQSIALLPSCHVPTVGVHLSLIEIVATVSLHALFFSSEFWKANKCFGAQTVSEQMSSGFTNIRALWAVKLGCNTPQRSFYLET